MKKFKKQKITNWRTNPIKPDLNKPNCTSLGVNRIRPLNNKTRWQADNKRKKDKVQKNDSLFLKTTNFKLIETKPLHITPAQ